MSEPGNEAGGVADKPVVDPPSLRNPWSLIKSSILTGSIVFICTFGADEDRSRCPN